MGIAREPYPDNGIAHARQGDTADMICARYLGEWSGTTETLIDMNHGLADLGPILPEGTLVRLPSPATTTLTPATTVKLWD